MFLIQSIEILRAYIVSFCNSASVLFCYVTYVQYRRLNGKIGTNTHLDYAQDKGRRVRSALRARVDENQGGAAVPHEREALEQEQSVAKT
jgi:hypothetical protein